jgi:pyruvate formate lyase activating enzyme
MNDRDDEQRVTRQEFLARCLSCTAGLSLVPGAVLAAGGSGGRGRERGLVRPREARYYEMQPEGRARCRLCPHGCVIAEGSRGTCGVRELRDGRLMTMAYGNPCAVHVDPIEKKPLFHFLPASQAFSVATAGCNLHCKNCQNWEISQRRPEETENIDLPPEDLVAGAAAAGCESIAYTYSDPDIFFEYAVDTARLARQQGLKNVLVTAGYINAEPQLEFCRTMDAANVDLKGFTEDFYRQVCSAGLQPILNALQKYLQEGVWLEVTHLVIPTLNDDADLIRQMCHWYYEHLGADVPLHFSRFQPRYQLKNLPPTPVETLELARRIAMDEGLRYAYVGNVPGHAGESTYCPNCGRTVIGRIGYSITEMNLLDGCCRFCGQTIAGVWSGR